MKLTLELNDSQLVTLAEYAEAAQLGDLPAPAAQHLVNQTIVKAVNQAVFRLRIQNKPIPDVACRVFSQDTIAFHQNSRRMPKARRTVI